MRKWQQMRGIKYTCSTSHEPSIMMRNISLIQNSCAITALILIWSHLTYGTSCDRLCAILYMLTFRHGFYKKQSELSCLGKQSELSCLGKNVRRRRSARFFCRHNNLNNSIEYRDLPCTYAATKPPGRLKAVMMLIFVLFLRMYK